MATILYRNGETARVPASAVQQHLKAGWSVTPPKTEQVPAATEKAPSDTNQTFLQMLARKLW